MYLLIDFTTPDQGTCRKDGKDQLQVTPTEYSLGRVRFNFNPDGIDDIHALHILTASFLTQCDEVLKGIGKHVSSGRISHDPYMEARDYMEQAKHYAEMACMFAIKARTVERVKNL